MFWCAWYLYISLSKITTEFRRVRDIDIVTWCRLMFFVRLNAGDAVCFLPRLRSLVFLCILISATCIILKATKLYNEIHVVCKNKSRCYKSEWCTNPWMHICAGMWGGCKYDLSQWHLGTKPTIEQNYNIRSLIPFSAASLPNV